MAVTFLNAMNFAMLEELWVFQRKMGQLHRNSCQYFSIQSQTNARAPLETTQGKGYEGIAEELVSHHRDKIQTFICQALNKNCLVYMQCPLNSSCYRERDELLQQKFLLTCPNVKQPFSPK